MADMWQRILLRELVPLLPRLLRHTPFLEKYFSGGRANPEVSSVLEEAQKLLSELEAQIIQGAAENRREMVELQSRLEVVQQESRLLREQLDTVEKNVNELRSHARVILIFNCALAGISIASLIMIALVLARVAH